MYQLRNLIDHCIITSDPKGNVHACQNFLNVVTESESLFAFAGCHDLQCLDVGIGESLKEGVPNLVQGLQTSVHYRIGLESCIMRCTGS